MTVFVVDKGAQKLIDQVLASTRVARKDIGTIAGPSHRQSGPHFPEDPPPAGNPPHQVDAVDFPHQPDKGLDCEKFTEELRLSEDPRLYLVIWDDRQFSSYAKDGHDPFTWRPYSGEDMHREHCHVEVNDVHHDETQDWMVFDMAGFPTAKEIADELFTRVFAEFADENGNGKRDGITFSGTVYSTKKDTFLIREKLEKGLELTLTDQDKADIAAKMVELLADRIIFIPKAKVQE